MDPLETEYFVVFVCSDIVSDALIEVFDLEDALSWILRAN